MVKVLVLGAHPDDAEFFAGGLLAMLKLSGATLKLVSVTNGQSGHQSIPQSELIVRRRSEAAAAGRVISSEYATWDFIDGSLQPTIDLRLAIIREIRTFGPDLVLTHRPFDYHPDHRAVGQAVVDASYMVRVPKIAPECPPPEREPIVAYMVDLFTRPCPFRADVIMDVSRYRPTVLDMLDCHRSQFYEWLPWIEGCLDGVPTSNDCAPDRLKRLEWLSGWYREKTAPRTARFWTNEYGATPDLIEAYEFSEYAGRPTRQMLDELFPNGIIVA
jgi:N-acetylglucosamine malate deacetylase 1